MSQYALSRMNWYGQVLHSSRMTPSGEYSDAKVRETVSRFAQPGQTVRERKGGGPLEHYLFS